MGGELDIVGKCIQHNARILILQKKTAAITVTIR
jgi:hypothetical protein